MTMHARKLKGARRLYMITAKKIINATSSIVKICRRAHTKKLIVIMYHST